MEKKVISLVALLLSNQLIYCSLKTASKIAPRAIGALSTGAQVVKSPSLRAIRSLVTVPKKVNFQSLAKPLFAQEQKSKDYNLKGLLPLGIIGWVANLFSTDQDKQKVEEQLLTEKLQKLDINDFDKLLYEIKNEQEREELTRKYINEHWEKIDRRDLSVLLGKYIQNEKEREELVRKYINKNWEKLDRYDLSDLLEHIEDKQARKNLKEEFFMIPKEKSLSSQHLQDNFANLYLNLRTVKAEMRELALEIMDYQYEQEKKGNVVYFHGQNWRWKEYADLYKALYKIDHTLQDNYIFLRFISKHIDTTHEKLIAENGVDACAGARQDLLFANRSIFANVSASNTIYYVQDNYDMSVKNIRNKPQLSNIFKEFGYEKELALLEKKHPALLERYSELHLKASQFGNFLVITMPQKTASKISYSAVPGGRRKGNFNQHEPAITNQIIPFDHEYCIVLGPTLLNPENAQKAGITIREYNAADPEIMAERDKVLAEIIELVKNYRNKL